MTNLILTEESNYEANKLRQLKVLLAEDNPLNIKLISLLFLQHGLKLDIAENGAEAVEKIRSTDYDIVLMDMEMPVLNGYQATALIRQQLKSKVPIIAMTAHAMAGEKEKCMQLGMNDYIAKPVNEERLFFAIHKLTGGQKASGKKAGTPISTQPFVFTKKVCKLDYLINVTRGNKRVMNDIVDIFIEETQAELSSLSAAIKRTNYNIIRDISHKLRSSFSLLGIAVLEPVFAEMEHLGTIASGIGKIKFLNYQVNMVFDQAKEEMKGE